METKKTRTPRKLSEKKPAHATGNLSKLKILITVVNRNKAEFYMDLLTSFEANFQTALLAQGTAKSETLYMLGLEDSDKSVIISVLREDKVAEAMQALEEKFLTIKNGKGIAFCVPMSSVIGVAIYQFLGNHRNRPIGKEEN